MRIKLGRGWAPEKKDDEYSQFAILELRILIDKIFNKKRDLTSK